MLRQLKHKTISKTESNNLLKLKKRSKRFKHKLLNQLLAHVLG
jgi:hypothetical protein